tara:strand:- start:313 stop:1317 length:1005 start_codon:yes stop_codon:yes gene_type:complete
MSRIALRSPYFFTYTIGGASGALSAKLTITIDTVLRYTLIKSVTAGTPTVFEVSELCRDYLTVDYDGSPTAGDTEIDIDLVMTFWTGVNASGSLITTISDTGNQGFDAYGYFSEGANWEPPYPLSFSASWLIAPKAGTNTEWEIFAPEGQGGYVPYMLSGVIGYSRYFAADLNLTIGVSAICTINRIPCSKYGDGERITFINKYGQFQELWFSLKKVLTTSTTKEEYQGINLTSSGSSTSYDISVPTKVVYNKKATEKITLNSGYYPEAYNAVFEQLLESEQIWIKTLNKVGTTEYLPVNVITSSFTKKTKLNDKLIDYTIEFAEAYDKINNVR